jgi:hypothetical protein
MNVFKIQKQCNVMLNYTTHAVQRAEERNVPMPSYIPLNTVPIAFDTNNGETSYSLSFKYLGVKYVMVVTDEMVVLTVYRLKDPVVKEKRVTRKEALKQYQRVLRSNKSEEYYTFKDGKYPHLEVEIGYESYCNA